MGGLPTTALSEGALSPCPVAGVGGVGRGGKLPESSEEAGKRDAPALRGKGLPDFPLPPPAPILQLSPQSLGRATLAEAKFTFLRGAWGRVQSPGSTEP